MDLTKLERFINRQKISFICSVDQNGYPNVKAMLRPRKHNGLKEFYFSTNVSAIRTQQYLNNPKASIYFCHKGFFRYTGILLIGTMEVLTDQTTKEMIWQKGDTIFYKQGITDPDYCVLRFTATHGRYYRDLASENFKLE